VNGECVKLSTRLTDPVAVLKKWKKKLYKNWESRINGAHLSVQYAHYLAKKKENLAIFQIATECPSSCKKEIS